MAIREEPLRQFVGWAAEYVTGDEKGQAQIYLDRLFQAFGQKGCLEVGGEPEFRIRKPAEDGGGTAFADYVWKPVVLIEMKRRGVNLAKHYRQAFDYWTRLVPNRPRYAVLCNFAEFWVYDFNVQMDVPVDKVPLAELPSRYGPLTFLSPTGDTPVFRNDHEKVTRQAADRLATCFNKLIVRRVPREEAQRFILQMLVALFAEDIGLLERFLIDRLLAECRSPADAYDLLGGLFEAMNTPGRISGGRFKGVDYFNGGLFAQPARLELHEDELNQLREAARSDWSQVRPEIFGTLFEHSLDKEKRHAFGAHFTSAVDIMKIVNPTIVEPWRNLVENADTLKELKALQQRMREYRVLDPACGSGNFLYLAYRELKRLEARLYERIAQKSKKVDPAQEPFGFVTADQFFGIDITPFAVELAKVTMMIGRKLAIDELHVTERALPLDNLDKNFLAADALIDASGRPTAWPPADAIIGNPPFLGAKRLKPERGADYVNAVRALYPDVPGMADYCVYWLRRAQDHLPACTARDPLAGRAGLVGTQNIRNNKSREGGLDYICAGGTVIEAVDNQPWSGEANVHVSIVNWVKHAAAPPRLTARERTVLRDKLLIPENKKLWFKVDPPPGARPRGKRGQGNAAKEYELDYRETTVINSALSDKTNVARAKTLRCNTKPQRVFQGQVPGHEAFVLSRSEAKALIDAASENAEVIHPFLIGRDVLTGDGRPTRMVIDFQDMDVLAASAYKKPFKLIQDRVLPDRKRKAEEGKSKDGALRPHHQLFLRYWWRHSYDRPEMIREIGSRHRFIVCSGVTKRPVFNFISSEIRPDHAVFAFVFEDDYSFGILQSGIHWQWFITKCSKLTERFRYTPPSVFDTFPWPQSPGAKEIDAVAVAGREVRRVREEALKRIKGGLRAVYRTLELPGKNPLKDAHAALDAAVLRTYGFSARKDLLKQILDLNLDVAARIDRGEPVTAPGVPSDYPKPKKLVTDDCIQP
ncbi:MAG: class I SAM-dependent DNA methyltransferase [Pirellulales bacterium]|nr:class I SAM-dependent DNA methyltransferase [Pirellulales bacterium]